jgi:hypothetical protein
MSFSIAGRTVAGDQAFLKLMERLLAQTLPWIKQRPKTVTFADLAVHPGGKRPVYATCGLGGRSFSSF